MMTSYLHIQNIFLIFLKLTKLRIGKNGSNMTPYFLLLSACQPEDLIRQKIII